MPPVSGLPRLRHASGRLEIFPYLCSVIKSTDTMRFEKDYVVSFREGRRGYPTTLLINAYNKEEAKEKCRAFVDDNARRYVKPEFINEEAIAKHKANLIFHFGVAMNTIIDARGNY